ncbi:MAG: hypothetical protein K6G10_09105 [Butyrivibrio sp.]|nr:hypothetical protein [Butyrivibrio sp.]
MVLTVIFSILKLVFWMLLIPLLIGTLFNFILVPSRRTVGITFILGFLISMADFELIAILSMTRVVFSAFSICCNAYTVSALTMAGIGLARAAWLFVKRGKTPLAVFPGESHPEMRDLLNPRSDPKLYKVNYSIESWIYWGIFFAILLFQMIMAVVMSSFDGDDAYYVVESLLAQQADVMNTILPYTGSSTSLDLRHALAVITMWIAFMAKKSAIHATIVSHCVIPLFVIPLVYLVYVEIGRVLFRTRQQIIPVFMIIVSFLMMFGNVSIYTPATFFLMRTWQGKAMVANLVFPLIFWLFLWMMEDVKRTREKTAYPRYDKLNGIRILWAPWLILMLVNTFSGVCSSMGVIFGSGLTALLTLILIFMSKDIRHLAGAFISVVPNALYLAMYFSLIGP